MARFIPAAVTFSVGITGAASFALAAGDAQDLAKKLSNPIANLISVPFQFNYDDGFGRRRRPPGYVNIQPVIPISISDDWNLISRTILPIVSQNDIVARHGSQFGLGDTTQSLFFSPKAPRPAG